MSTFATVANVTTENCTFALSICSCESASSKSLSIKSLAKFFVSMLNLGQSGRSQFAEGPVHSSGCVPFEHKEPDSSRARQTERELHSNIPAGGADTGELSPTGGTGARSITTGADDTGADGTGAGEFNWRSLSQVT